VSTPSTEYVTPAEAADLLRLSRETVYRLVRRGDLRAIRVGNGPNASLRIHPDDLVALIRPANARDVLRAAQPIKETRDA
jgi:excisionase family DNA binding protein